MVSFLAFGGQTALNCGAELYTKVFLISME